MRRFFKKIRNNLGDITAGAGGTGLGAAVANVLSSLFHGEDITFGMLAIYFIVFAVIGFILFSILYAVFDKTSST